MHVMFEIVFIFMLKTVMFPHYDASVGGLLKVVAISSYILLPGLELHDEHS